MLDNVKRFDMKKKPKRPMLILVFIVWLAAKFVIIKNRIKIDKKSVKGLKGPYLLLCNHNSFLDFFVTYAATFPRRFNPISTIDGYYGFPWGIREGLMRCLGCICKRKFTNDAIMVRHLARTAKAGDVPTIFPEARYSVVGTEACLPSSLGKLVKLLNIPVVTMVMNGHHLKRPFWAEKKRKVSNMRTYMTKLLDVEEIKSLSADEIIEKIRKALYYNDYKYQKDNNIIIDEEFRAEGLHKALYQCAACGTEYKMTSYGTTLKCNHCGKEWEMTELGETQSQRRKNGIFAYSRLV